MRVLCWMLLLAGLSGCTLLPKAGPAPTQLQLMNVTHSLPAGSLQPPQRVLLVERPLATAALSSRSIWYQTEANHMMPFRDHLWNEPLPQQLQMLTVAYLNAQMEMLAVYADQAGTDADLRLRLALHDWYLDQTDAVLRVSIHSSLIDAKGHPQARWQWRYEEALEHVDAAGLVAAGQRWLERWLSEQQQALDTHLHNSP